MTTPPAPEPHASLSDLVEAFLRANPCWLAERPDLYRTLAPPARLHGEPMADHMAAMLHAERRHAAAMSAQADTLLAAGRAAAGLAQCVQHAVLALIRAADPGECISGEIPAILGIDAAALCLEDHRANARTLPPGTVNALFHGRDLLCRDNPADAPLLHAEAARLARRDALIRVPWSGPAALIALVSRDAVALDAAQRSPLVFLGRAAAAALERGA